MGRQRSAGTEEEKRREKLRKMEREGDKESLECWTREKIERSLYFKPERWTYKQSIKQTHTHSIIQKENNPNQYQLQSANCSTYNNNLNRTQYIIFFATSQSPNKSLKSAIIEPGVSFKHSVATNIDSLKGVILCRETGWHLIFQTVLPNSPPACILRRSVYRDIVEESVTLHSDQEARSPERPHSSLPQSYLLTIIWDTPCQLDRVQGVFRTGVEYQTPGWSGSWAAWVLDRDCKTKVQDKKVIWAISLVSWRSFHIQRASLSISITMTNMKRNYYSTSQNNWTIGRHEHPSESRIGGT